LQAGKNTFRQSPVRIILVDPFSIYLTGDADNSGMEKYIGGWIIKSAPPCFLLEIGASVILQAICLNIPGSLSLSFALFE